ncbi:hypothetical protein [Streptomyces sp. CB03911]|uniref:hypothetical protein n=1 Tax=Streptomycetaceae TaxID=2062 RepID=UPI00093E9786|nr:hypothetical protein [Streptomyces sp. CB03911]OKI24347.1 hypothetical protein A6A07_05610 [Streptomyces sp. CB03911]
MPGSVNISHHEATVAIGAPDAQRLASMLAEIAYLLEIPGPNRLSDSQLSILCDGKAADRDEVMHWARELAAELKARY